MRDIYRFFTGREVPKEENRRLLRTQRAYRAAKERFQIMGYSERLPHGEKRATSEMQAAQPEKLSTGEYRQMLHQQYERLSWHQQIIEAERRAENNL